MASTRYNVTCVTGRSERMGAPYQCLSAIAPWFVLWGSMCGPSPLGDVGLQPAMGVGKVRPLIRISNSHAFLLHLALRMENELRYGPDLSPTQRKEYISGLQNGETTAPQPALAPTQRDSNAIGEKYGEGAPPCPGQNCQS